MNSSPKNGFSLPASHPLRVAEPRGEAELRIEVLGSGGGVLLRPDVELTLSEEKIAVSVAGGPAGELSLPDEQVSDWRSLLEKLPSAPITAERLAAFSREPRGATVVTSLLESLVKSGLAVRYADFGSVEQAGRTASWTSHVDRVAQALRQSTVLVVGPVAPIKDLFRYLKDWGIPTNFATIDNWQLQPEMSPSLVVAVGISSDQLWSLSRWCYAQNIPLLPIQTSDFGWSVGPVFLRDVSACPFCGPRRDAMLAERVPDHHEAADVNARGWKFVAECVSDYLSSRPGAEAPFMQHRISKTGELVGSRRVDRAPRCPICSRLNRYPENAVLHG